MITGIYSFNIAVNDLKSAVDKYQDVFGVEPRYMGPDEFVVPNLEGYAFNIGGTIIHIIASKTDDTSIANFVKKNGEGVFLVSMVVDDIEKEIPIMKEKGLKVVLDKNLKAKIGKVNFVHPKSMHGVQWEVLQLNDEYKK
ncbi:MAG: VOC family protein [Thermodesulfobacteriota bacterium]|nr:VOC family protein [Thermodesulfobacteriota bacterium]